MAKRNGTIHTGTTACVRRFVAVASLGLAIASWCTSASGQPPGTTVPYKLGTLERNGRVFLGLVLGDTQMRVVDIRAANEAWEKRNPSARILAAPADMRALIREYDSGWRARLENLARAATASGSAAYIYSMGGVEILPPVTPAVVLNADSNYPVHLENIYKRFAAQGTPLPPPPPPKSIPGIWERKPGDTRPNPSMFLKSPAILTGGDDPIEVPRGRKEVDWECEFDVVVGKTARFVPTERAADYIFGYTIQLDVSDRDLAGLDGVNMLIMKNHDTFGPLGPFIVPKEFVLHPMNVRQVFTLNGAVEQDSNTSKMVHSIYDLLAFGSNILTLHPGDVISAGSPAGTNMERLKPRWMRPGDKAVCSIAGIGTQHHTVIREPLPAG